MKSKGEKILELAELVKDKDPQDKDAIIKMFFDWGWCMEAATNNAAKREKGKEADAQNFHETFDQPPWECYIEGNEKV